MIIYLDGPINAGKTTVGRLLAKRLPNSVHIEADELRHFATGLSLEQAISYVLQDVISLTKNWVERGFHVIISWPISRQNYSYLVDKLSVVNEPLFPFTLLPPKQVALQNRGNRPLSKKERARIEVLYATLYSDTRVAGKLIDNDDQNPDETVALILGFIAEQEGGDTGQS